MITPFNKRPKRIKLPPDEYKKLTRRVFTRDGWQCRVPRCKARSGLHCHHIIFRSHGGDDASYNLITVCNEHHEQIHRHEIQIIAREDMVNADRGVVWKFYDRR